MTEAQAIAADLKADGQAMTLTRTLQGEYTPATGEVGEPVTQRWTVYGITANYNSQTKLASQTQPGTAILSGDKKATIAAIADNGAAITPLPGDTLTVQRVVWQVIAVDTLAPQGEDLLHNLQIRK